MSFTTRLFICAEVSLADNWSYVFVDALVRRTKVLKWSLASAQRLILEGGVGINMPRGGGDRHGCVCCVDGSS